MFLVFFIIGHQLEFGAYYHVCLFAAAGVAVYHQYLIKDRRPDNCFRAFLINNWLGAVVLAGITLHYLFDSPT